MTTAGRQYGIRANPHVRVDDRVRATQFLQDTFLELLAAHRKLCRNPRASLADDNMLIAKRDDQVRFYGLVIQLTHMLVADDPVQPCRRGTACPDEASVVGLFGFMRDLGIHLPELDAAHNTDEVWALFFRAVDAALINDLDEVYTLCRQLGHLAPNQLWIERVTYYAKHVVPEWQLWFTGLDYPPLPRI